MVSVSNAIFGNADINSDAYHALCSFTLPPGAHIIVAVVDFPTNDIGFRRIGLSNDGKKFHMNRFSMEAKQAVSGNSTPVFLHFIYTVAEESTVYLMAQQNSGNILSNCTYGICVFSFANAKRYTIPHEFLNQPI